MTTTDPESASPDPAAARVLRACLDDLAHPKLYTAYSWAVDVKGNPVPTMDPAAVRWSLKGLVTRHTHPDTELRDRIWQIVEAHLPSGVNFEARAMEEDRVRVFRAALEDAGEVHP